MKAKQNRSVHASEEHVEVLITQQNCRSLGEDLKMIPGLLISFCVDMIQGALAAWAILWSLCIHEHRRLKKPAEGLAYSPDFIQSKKEHTVLPV